MVPQPGRPPRPSISITRREPVEEVKARVARLTPRLARKLILRGWWTDLPVPLAVHSAEGDHGWAWDEYAAPIQDDPLYGSYVALTATGRWLEAQGAIIYRLDALSLLEPGQGAAYLQFVASAPRNRKLLVGEWAKYRGVGEELVVMAMLDSIYNGRGGRLLGEPLPEAIPFYEKLNFLRALDPQSGRIYYEIPGAEAQVHIRERGWI